MATTIQISEELKEELTKRRLFDRETYEDVIWDLIQDNKEVSEELIKRLEVAKKQIEEGKTHSFEKIKKELGL